MNFAVPFMRDFEYLNEPVQLNINYKPLIKELDDFISVYQKHRINLIMHNFKEDDCKIIKALREKYPDSEIITCLPFYHKDLESILASNELPHYYNEIVTNWDRFNGFLSLDVTDIFIGEELAFSAKILSNSAKKNNKSLRSFCNVCESSWDETSSIKTFFIRPEDIDLYEGIIDTFEFYIGDNDLQRLNTFYSIYVKDKKWYGKLKEIIVGYEGNEDSRFIIPRFGEKRLNCGKICAQGEELSCHICDRIVELSETLKDKQIMVSIDK